MVTISASSINSCRLGISEYLSIDKYDPRRETRRSLPSSVDVIRVTDMTTCLDVLKINIDLNVSTLNLSVAWQDNEIYLSIQFNINYISGITLASQKSIHLFLFRQKSICRLNCAQTHH